MEKKKRKKKGRRILLGIAVLIAAAAAAAILYVRHQTGKMNYVRDDDVVRLEESEEETAPLRAADIYSSADVRPVPEQLAQNTFTILVIGVGSPEEEESQSTVEQEAETQSTGEDEEQRSDAQAVITMTVHHDRKMCFFLNYNVDTYAEIPGYNAGRLGHAYALGGGPLLAETIMANYGLPIDHYTAISLKDVAEVIGMPEFETLDISTQGLDVVAELVYRLGDLNPAQVASYISKLLPFVTHNMTPQEVLSTVLQIPRIIPYYSERYQIPLEGMYTEAEGVPVPDAKTMSERIQQTIYGAAGGASETETGPSETQSSQM